MQFRKIRRNIKLPGLNLSWGSVGILKNKCLKLQELTIQEIKGISGTANKEALIKK